MFLNLHPQERVLHLPTQVQSGSFPTSFLLSSASTETSSGIVGVADNVGAFALGDPLRGEDPASSLSEGVDIGNRAFLFREPMQFIMQLLYNMICYTPASFGVLASLSSRTSDGEDGCVWILSVSELSSSFTKGFPSE